MGFVLLNNKKLEEQVQAEAVEEVDQLTANAAILATLQLLHNSGVIRVERLEDGTINILKPVEVIEE